MWPTRLCRLSLLDCAVGRPEALDRGVDVVVVPFCRIGRREVGGVDHGGGRLGLGGANRWRPQPVERREDDVARLERAGAVQTSGHTSRSSRGPLDAVTSMAAVGVARSSTLSAASSMSAHSRLPGTGGGLLAVVRCSTAFCLPVVVTLVCFEAVRGPGPLVPIAPGSRPGHQSSPALRPGRTRRQSIPRASGGHGVRGEGPRERRSRRTAAHRRWCRRMGTIGPSPLGGPLARWACDRG